MLKVELKLVTEYSKTYAGIKDKGGYSFQTVVWSGNTFPGGLSFPYVNYQFFSPFWVLPKARLESMLRGKILSLGYI